MTGVAGGVGHIVATSGSFTGSVDITVTGAPGGQQLTLNVSTAEKLPNGTQQFSVTSGGEGPFTWTVNGVLGGNATFGTITQPGEEQSGGFYTAPSAVPSPSAFDVCAVQAVPAATGCAHVTISPIPTSGADVIVFNDINSFDEEAAANPNNVLMFQNLVNYTGPGPRSTQTGVLRTCGHQAVTCATDVTFANTMANGGYQMTTVSDPSLPIPIPSNVKLLILSLPQIPYTIPEINAMKQFSAEGGRILFIGEYEGYYPTAAINGVENVFFQDMGAVMRNTGSSYDCGYNTVPLSNLRPHQVTQGLTNLTMGCASAVVLGPNDYPLYVSLDQQHVLAAVAKVDVTPLPVGGNRIRARTTTVTPRPSAPRDTDPVGKSRAKTPQPPK